MVTDPPYDQMIAYADASDLFYVWLKRCLHSTWPELVVTADSHGAQEKSQEIIVKRDGGVVTRLKDVARVEIQASQFALRSLLDNRQAVALPIFQAPGSNAIQISDEVRATMAELKESFPPGVDYAIAYDPTVFVRGSIEAVIHTLLEATALVVLVVILFLQTWRASIIPLIAVPVSIIGTFAVMYVFGFSINALSLFGLVLAIGIVVDDAIVVVENVERNIEDGLTPYEAALKAMREVTGPIVAIALVLCAVFVPIAFLGGLTGELYRQFAVTISIAVVISGFADFGMSCLPVSRFATSLSDWRAKARSRPGLRRFGKLVGIPEGGRTPFVVRMPADRIPSATGRRPR